MNTLTIQDIILLAVTVLGSSTLGGLMFYYLFVWLA